MYSSFFCNLSWIIGFLLPLIYPIPLFRWKFSIWPAFLDWRGSLVFVVISYWILDSRNFLFSLLFNFELQICLLLVSWILWFMGISVYESWIFGIMWWELLIFVLLHDCKFPILFFSWTFRFLEFLFKVWFLRTSRVRS